MKKNNKKVKVPFFAQLLTKQELSNASAGAGPTKPWIDLAQTQKYPSDGDDSTPLTDNID